MKNQLKMKKTHQIKGKSTKIATNFRINKPNSKNIKIDISPFKTGKYEILPAWRSERTNPIQSQCKPKQSQFWPIIRPGKPKTKPNKANSNHALSAHVLSSTEGVEWANFVLVALAEELVYSIGDYYDNYYSLSFRLTK